MDDTGHRSIIRHNAWPGFTAYHMKGTQKHGSIYVGDGLKNDNITFMI